RVLGQLLHPIAQLRRVNVQVLRRLHIGHASILDQAHGLKFELSRKLPSLHDPPPAPSKHLTRCLRNRVQANELDAKTEKEIPKGMIGRRLTQREAKRLLGKFGL